MLSYVVLILGKHIVYIYLNRSSDSTQKCIVTNLACINVICQQYMRSTNFIYNIELSTPLRNKILEDILISNEDTLFFT